MFGALNLLSKGGSSSKARKPVLDDVVIYPVHMMDDTEGLRKYMMAWTMRFNDVLDADKLYSSLTELIKTGEWRKLGGRVKRKPSGGGLEIHVPKAFTAEKQAVAFSHENFSDTYIADHPLASKLPVPTDEPSIQAGPLDFKDLASPDVPSTLDEMISRETPQLGLHVNSFKDATIVVLSWPHTMMDALGLQALLQAWSLILSGKKNEVPPILGAQKDVIWEAADPSKPTEEKEDLLIEQKRLRGMNLAMFMGRFVKDMVRNPVVETKAICLPKGAFDKIRVQALRDAAAAAAAAAQPQDTQDNPIVSDSDVLAAWAARMVTLSEPQPRPAVILGTLNARFLLKPFLKPSGVYIQNMDLFSVASLSVEDSRGTIGQIALSHQQSLKEQSTEAQVLSFLRLTRKEREAGRELSPLFGEASSVPVIVNNMTRAGIVQAADFGAAVVQQGEESSKRRNSLGTMVYHHFQPLGPDVKKRNWFVVLGKDHDGNYWITADLIPRAWAQVEEELRKL